jgi:hypothetical protein
MNTTSKTVTEQHKSKTYGNHQTTLPYVNKTRTPLTSVNGWIAKIANYSKSLQLPNPKASWD